MKNVSTPFTNSWIAYDSHLKAVFTLRTTSDDSTTMSSAVVRHRIRHRCVHRFTTLRDDIQQKRALFQTNELPFSVGDETGRVAGFAVQLKVDSSRVISPRAELHTAPLIVEREPADVDLTGAVKHAGRHPEAAAVRRNDDVRRERTVDVLVRTVVYKQGPK